MQGCVYVNIVYILYMYRLLTRKDESLGTNGQQSGDLVKVNVPERGKIGDGKRQRGRRLTHRLDVERVDNHEDAKI